jgi:hypothetical protein
MASSSKCQSAQYHAGFAEQVLEVWGIRFSNGATDSGRTDCSLASRLEQYLRRLPRCREAINRRLP